jgi:hypothetical protein
MRARLDVQLTVHELTVDATVDVEFDTEHRDIWSANVVFATVRGSEVHIEPVQEALDAALSADPTFLDASCVGAMEVLYDA